MRYLLDTNVVSEIQRTRPEPAVVRWFDSVDGDELFLSVLTLGEISQGIGRLRPRDPSRAQRLQAWLETLATAYRDRTLAVDHAVATRWGALNARRPLPVVDGLLAATALEHGAVLATRNGRDLAGTPVRVVDPWQF